MTKTKHMTVVICMSFLTMLFLSGLVKIVHGEERKTSIKQEYSEEQAEYKQKSKEKLDEFDKNIEQLAVEAKEAGYKVKAESNKGLEELKEKRAALKDHMEKLEASSKKTWEAAKEKMNEAMDDLEKTYNKVRANFK